MVDERTDAGPPPALIELARRHTTGEVSVRRHAASRSRVLDGFPARRSRPAAWSLIALASTAVLGAMSFGAIKLVRERAGITAEPNATPAAASTSAATPASSAAPEGEDDDDPLRPHVPATLTIRVVPDDATIFWDDTELTGNPARITDPPDGKTHRIRAEARGYVTETESIVAGESVTELRFDLEEIPTDIGPIAKSSSIANADDVIDELRSRFRDCYVEGLDENAKMAGKATVNLKVSEKGSVTSSEITDRDGLSAKVTTCLAYVASDAHFETEGKSGTMKIPIAFRAKRRP